MLADKRQIEIEELEKKYYNFYLELLRENEEYIKAQFQKMNGRLELAETYLLENVIAIGFQELIRSIFFRNTDYDVYMLPTSSDTSFESSDAIIQIDIKTIKSGDIYGDDGMRIIPHPNQSTYPGVNEQNSKQFVPALKTQIAVAISKDFPVVLRHISVTGCSISKDLYSPDEKTWISLLESHKSI